VILLVTGGRDFCEAVTTAGIERDRETYMAERIALGFALDFIAPSSVIVGDASGADRWARIWCDRRGVSISDGRAESALVFPGGYRPDLPTYDVAIR